MRIIDSKKDFYDHLQHAYKDDTIVFDRRDSFIYKKEDMIRSIRYGSNIVGYRDSQHTIITPFLLLQICNKFWLFYIDCIFKPTGQGFYDIITDYSLELLDVWDDYRIERKLIFMGIQDTYFHLMRRESVKEAKEKYLAKHKQHSVEIIKSNPYQNKMYDITRRPLGYGNTSGIPILKDIGITKSVLPLDVYLAFEEYWYTERASREERRESIGLTDIEKIENHGFDKKTSFRGKN